MKEEFYFPSKDGNTEIHTIEWKPEGEIKAVLQICHGMIEYVDRYDEFAQFLSEQGIYVVGNDHLGHGKSVQSKLEYGYFQKEYGNACLLADMHMLRTKTAKKYPDVPYFMLGHSMGSILLRQYIQMYGNGLAGAILIGVVAERPIPVLNFGKVLCKGIAVVKGDHYRSKLVEDMVIGAFNKKFKHPKTRADWVTSDDEKLQEYINDPLCSFHFTVNAYGNMLEGMTRMEKKENVFMIPKHLPILMSAGVEDPAGKCGKGVRKVYEKYKESGIRDVTLQLYAGDRHELLNETDRDQVYQDILAWMENRI